MTQQLASSATTQAFSSLKNAEFRPLIFIVSIGILLTIIVSTLMYTSHQSYKRTEFDLVGAQYANLLQNGLDRNINALKFTGDFFNYSSEVTRAEFAEFTKKALARYPDIHAFAWTPLISDEQRPYFENKAQAEGFNEFTFTRKNSAGQMVKTEPLPEYVVAYYIEPMQGNELALGYTINTQQARSQAINKAFSSAALTVSAGIKLVQESADELSVLLLLPLYEKGIVPSPASRLEKRKGLVVEVIKIGRFFEHSVRELPFFGVDVYLYDITDDKEHSLLYFHPADKQQGTTQPLLNKTQLESGLHSTINLSIADRQWQVYFSPTAQYQHEDLIIEQLAIITTGLGFTALLGILLWQKINFNQNICQSNLKLQRQIDERNKAENQANKMTEYLDTVLLNLPIGVSILEGPDLRCVRVNPTMATLSDMTRDDYLDKPLSQILSKSQTRFINQLHKVLKTGLPIVHQEFTQTLPGQSKEPLFLIEWHIPIRRPDEGASAIVSVMLDISELKNTQEQLGQSAKLEALGTLAGGIAHDFNNILAAILGNTEIAQMTLDQDNPARNYLSNIEKSAVRAANLVKQILTFSRMQSTELNAMDLSQCIRDSLSTIRATLPKNIIIEQQLPAQCPLILTNSSQIEQIMLNLYNNAVHSIEPDAGTIRVIVKVLRLENPSENLGLQAGEYVRLTVIDNGKGIAPEHLERMFDPFFTTKEVGKGTGLGLSVVHGIVERHNGKIIVKSQLSKGTTFALYFPTVQTQAHVTSLKHPAQEKNNSGQNKHILLVEDEETLINLYQQYLQKHGYKVTVAKNGVEALEVFTANPQQIDLVLTDQSMPKMTGKDLIKALFKIRPDIPVILSTGYSDVMTDEEALQMGIKKYLVKPIKLSVLERCIVECLG